jgi:hypothetical protein
MQASTSGIIFPTACVMMFREADYVPRPHRFPYGSSYTRLFLNGLSHERRGRLACLDDIS